MSLLKNKIAVVTGGGRGIGRATAAQFCDEGATVIIAEYDEKIGRKAANEIGCNYFYVDVSNEESVISLFKYIKETFNHIDILVNNAGILLDSRLVDMTPEQYDAVIKINQKGVYLCGRAAAKMMIENGSGIILNASSVVADNGNYGQSNYVASKTSVIGMTKVWSRELGPKGIRVNAISPGFIKTKMTSGMPKKIIEMMKDKVPSKRWGQPKDVANAYTFLASDEASYITGTVLNVDGGVVV
tara:strand:- start:1706 stop:2434 length:729 start_codon:yes stop_codon:yes gene_type:complete